MGPRLCLTGFSLTVQVGSRAHRLSCPVAYVILVPQPGIELESPVLKDSFNHWTTREVPHTKKCFLDFIIQSGQENLSSIYHVSLQYPMTCQYIDLLLLYCRTLKFSLTTSHVKYFIWHNFTFWTYWVLSNWGDFPFANQ